MSMNLRRDVRTKQMLSAAVQIDPDLSNGGDYDASITVFLNTIQ